MAMFTRPRLGMSLNFLNNFVENSQRLCFQRLLITDNGFLNNCVGVNLKLKWTKKQLPTVNKSKYSSSTSYTKLSNFQKDLIARASACCLVQFRSPVYISSFQDFCNTLIYKPKEVTYFSSKSKFFGFIEFQSEKENAAFIDVVRTKEEIGMYDIFSKTLMWQKSNKNLQNEVNQDLKPKEENEINIIKLDKTDRGLNEEDKRIHQLLNKCSDLSSQMFTLKENLQLSSLDLLLRQYMCSCVSSCIQESGYNPARAFLVGSTVTGLATIYSDVDIVITAGRPMRKVDAVTQLLHASTRIFMYLSWLKVKEKIFHARVPILQLYSSLFNGAVEISCSMQRKSCSQNMSKLLQILNLIDPRYLPLAFTVKVWCLSRELAIGGVKPVPNTFCFLMLVVYYLQSIESPILPPLHGLIIELGEGTDEEVIIEYCKIKTQENNASVGELLKGFFRFYAEFEFEDDVHMSVLSGTLSKTTRKNCFYLENPLDESQNLFSQVARRKSYFNMLRYEFKLGLKLLESSPVSDDWGLTLLFKKS